MRGLVLVCVWSCYGRLEIVGEGPPYGGPFDEEQASALWSELQPHLQWPALAPPSGMRPSTDPDGAFYAQHANSLAVTDPAALPLGSIILRRNFTSEDETALAGYTAMKRIDNFNPEGGDWFWAKFAPDGSLELDELGVPLAGAVGKGGTNGCISCHANAPGGDFVFSNGDGS
jgi:hypothetical protein